MKSKNNNKNRGNKSKRNKKNKEKISKKQSPTSLTISESHIEKKYFPELCPFNCKRLSEYKYNVHAFKNELNKNILTKTNNILYKSNESIFKIENEIGLGKYGTINNLSYIKLNQNEEKRYICKIIKETKIKNFTDFYNEILIQFRCSCISDNVPEILCVAKDNERNIYIIMEYVEYDLQTYIENKKLTDNTEKCLFIILALLEVSKILSVLQEQLNFQHRDLTCDNVMFNKDKDDNYKFYIIDFGMSTIMDVPNYSNIYNYTNNNYSHDLRILYFSCFKFLLKMKTRNESLLVKTFKNDYNLIRKKYNKKINNCDYLNTKYVYCLYKLYNFMDPYFLPSNIVENYQKYNYNLE